MHCFLSLFRGNRTKRNFAFRWVKPNCEPVKDTLPTDQRDRECASQAYSKREALAPNFHFCLAQISCERAFSASAFGQGLPKGLELDPGIHNHRERKRDIVGAGIKDAEEWIGLPADEESPRSHRLGVKQVRPDTPVIEHCGIHGSVQMKDPGIRDFGINDVFDAPFRDFANDPPRVSA